jgi:arsenite/tail-anchored protein-transporting ATPase
VLAERLGTGRRLTFVGGKGGVGKSTVAAALALELADRGEAALLVSVDPAHSAADVLGCPVGPEPVPVAGAPGLRAMEVDARRERERFLARHRGALLRLLDRGTYMDEADAESLLELPLPGADELAAVLRLLELVKDEPNVRIVVDTAPTGHTLRLLGMPAEVRGWLDALGAMEARHRQVAEALAGAYREDEAAAFLAGVEEDLRGFSALLTDADATRFVVVNTGEPVVRAETRRLRAALAAEGIALGGTVLNGAPPADAGDDDADAPPLVRLPALDAPPVGIDALRNLASAADSDVLDMPPAVGMDGRLVPRLGGGVFPVEARQLFVVGGKGGVGKSTVASALAARLAADGRGPVLLLSTDPAGSLGDVWGTPVDETPRPAPGVADLTLRQVDAAAAWDRFRERYRTEAEEVTAGLLGGALTGDADRAVAARLMELAPPGIDELMALEEVTERLNDAAGAVIVLDTAPTGHLLRLLEAPADVLQWAHAVLRILLRYRQVVRLGGAAERVLRFAHDLRTLHARLTDPARTAVWLVALPEVPVAAETRRLVERLRALDMPPQALVVNRAWTGGGPERVRAPEVVRRLVGDVAADLTVAAPEEARGPAGASALTGFAASWRRLEGDET